MTEKKTTKKAVTAEKEAPVKKAGRKAAPKAQIFVDAENAGWSAGDVYQALSVAAKSLSVEELEKATGKSATEILLGIGWLLKEGKIKGDAGKVVLA